MMEAREVGACARMYAVELSRSWEMLSGGGEDRSRDAASVRHEPPRNCCYGVQTSERSESKTKPECSCLESKVFREW